MPVQRGSQSGTDGDADPDPDGAAERRAEGCADGQPQCDPGSGTWRAVLGLPSGR
jgi:hypothetical protein